MKIYNYFKNIAEENISQEFRLKNVDEIIYYLIGEINRNELVSKKHKRFCATLNYIEYFLVLAYTITGFVFISAFASLVGIPIGFTSSEIGLKICAKAAGIKQYKSIIKKRKRSMIK